jgi:hypothetical protein
MQDESRLRGFQNCEHSRSTTEMQQAATAGRDRLIVAGGRAEAVAEFVVAFAEALGCGEALEAPHTACAAFHAPMILLQSVILVGAGPMHDRRPTSGSPAGSNRARPW